MDRIETDDETGGELIPPLAERRYHRRYPSGLSAYIDVDGAVRAVTIMDLSLGGAGLAPAFPALVGAPVELEITALYPRRRLRARILSVSRYRTHLLFNCNEEEQTALISFLLATGEDA